MENIYLIVINGILNYMLWSDYTSTAGDLSVHKYHRERPKELCCLLVESGFSFTHVVPYIQGKKQRNAIIRIDMGGKLITNHLKEIISYRCGGYYFTIADGAVYWFHLQI